MADNVNITLGSGDTVASDQIGGAQYQRVKIIHGVDGTNDGDSSTTNPFPVMARNVIDGTLATVVRVTNLVDGTLSTVTRVDRVMNVIDGTISVENITRVRNLVDGTLSLVTRVDRVMNVVDGTLTTVTGVDRVRNVVDGTLSTVQRVQNVVDGTLTTVTGVDRVRNLIDGTLTTVTRVDRVMNLIDGTLTTVTGVDRVRNLVDGTLTTVTRVDRVMNLIDGTLTTVSPGTAAANLGKAEDAVHTSGDVGVMALGIRRDTDVASSGTTGDYEPFSTDNLGRLRVVNMTSTGVIPVTASSTSAAVSVSGATVVSPIVGSVIKVFAFSLTTTAQVHLAARFTNGAGTSPTEFWRVALLAPSAGIAGANLAVTPPGYLWATASGSTLSLVLDSASLVHYSVSYFRESA